MALPPCISFQVVPTSLPRLDVIKLFKNLLFSVSKFSAMSPYIKSKDVNTVKQNLPYLVVGGVSPCSMGSRVEDGTVVSYLPLIIPGNCFWKISALDSLEELYSLQWEGGGETILIIQWGTGGDQEVPLRSDHST